MLGLFKLLFTSACFIIGVLSTKAAYWLQACDGSSTHTCCQEYVLYLVLSGYKQPGAYVKFGFIQEYLSVNVKIMTAEHGFEFQCQLIDEYDPQDITPKTPVHLMKCHATQQLMMRTRLGRPEGYCYPESSASEMNWPRKRGRFAQDRVDARAPVFSAAYTAFDRIWNSLTEAGRRTAAEREQQYLERYFQYLSEHRSSGIHYQALEARARAMAHIRPREPSVNRNAGPRTATGNVQQSNQASSSNRASESSSTGEGECHCATTLGGCSCIPIGSRAPVCAFCREGAQNRNRLVSTPTEAEMRCIDLQAAAMALEYSTRSAAHD